MPVRLQTAGYSSVVALLDWSVTQHYVFVVRTIVTLTPPLALTTQFRSSLFSTQYVTCEHSTVFTDDTYPKHIDLHRYMGWLLGMTWC